MWTVREIAEMVQGEIREVRPEVTVRLPRISSKEIQPGDLFVALQGEHTHGITYAEEALKRGALAVLTDRDQPGLPRILVKDSLEALARWAQAYRTSLESIKVVTITGSVGKTTTKDLLVFVLQARFRVFGAPKSFNNQIGVPLTLLHTPCRAEVVVLELGTNHPGEIEPLARLAQPHLGILTKIGRSHLEFFPSMEAIASEKAQMLRHLTPGPVWIHEANRRFSQIFERVTRPGVSIRWYGWSEDADIRAMVVDESLRQMTWRVDGQEVTTPQRGKGFIENALAVFAVATSLGMSPQEVIHRIESFPGTPMRMEWLRIGPWEILNDAYNANPESMKNLLEAAKEDEKTRIIFVLGDMLELGPKSEALHREVGEVFVTQGHRYLITVGEQSRAIAEAAREKGLHEVWHFPSLDEAAQFLQTFLKPGDLLVLKASRRMALERLLEMLKMEEA